MAKNYTFSYAFLSEILSSPKIKPLVQRLHPSATLPVLKSVFDDVSDELWSAVKEQRRPEINELIERAVVRLKDLIGIAEPLVVDARGRVCPNDLERLAPCALEEGAWLLSEPQSEYSRKQDAQREKDLLTRLARLGGAEAAIVFPNAETARVAALNALAVSRKNLVVARRDLYQLDSGERLEDSFNVFPELERREVGACNAVSLADYARACDGNTGLIWRASGRWSPDGANVPVYELATLKGNASERAFAILGEVEFAPLIDLSEFMRTKVPTIADRLKSGYDVVLCNGAQLIGGPSCGLAFGARSWIESIKKTPIARFSKTNRVTLGMLGKTIALYDDRAAALENIPILRTLSTSPANLESRAKRLAAILETFSCVQYARYVEGTSTLCANAVFGTSPTRQIEVKLRGHSPAEFAAKLEKTSPRLLARWTQDVLVIDMKTLAPDQDVVVSELFERLSNSERAEIL